MLTLGSLFDGIGTWQLSAKHNGIKPLWSCEIDPYPSAVSHYHFPETKQYGDIKEIHGNSIEPVDVLCAGTPCQNLSQAGDHKGLNGEKSSLFYEAIRILQEMRRATNGKYPRFFVWENVVGSFTSNHGNDFRTVLEEIGQIIFQCLSLVDGQPAEWQDFRSVTSHGESLTLNIGEFPSVVVVSSLSQILQPQEDVPQKYFLSKRGCLGILRRAAVKNKTLPTELKQALREQAV